MDRVYSFYDYEYAYYHQQYYKCIEIGIYLLSFINNDKARDLSKRLSETSYSWDMPEDEANEFAQLMLDVKIWLMIHSYY